MPSLLFRQLTVLLNEPDNIYMRWHIPNSNNYATIFQFELSCFSLEITFNPSCRFISSKFLFKYMLSIQNNAMTQTDLNNKPLHILTVYGMRLCVMLHSTFFLDPIFIVYKIFPPKQYNILYIYIRYILYNIYSYIFIYLYIIYNYIFI